MTKDQAEFSCAIINGSAEDSADESVRLMVRKDGRTLIKFELPSGEFFRAITGRLTMVDLI